MPSRMCINPIHNNKGLFHQSDNANSEERWAASSCAMDSLFMECKDRKNHTATMLPYSFLPSMAAQKLRHAAEKSFWNYEFCIKGWRLPDMMFATKCSLSDACNTIAKQLENVFSSIAASTAIGTVLLCQVPYITTALMDAKRGTEGRKDFLIGYQGNLVD
ncbi:hypothetical protein HYC85_025193 [Camellia sinensis]|uniref:DUF1664 domain-containing protein n=1 Tax=Camellia sinensis TaxID=4442 RepID=A0A7J7GAT1_CAMSI|nr:hypothetical protein HYC85_025193 [Camellia sinensis]